MKVASMSDEAMHFYRQREIEGLCSQEPWDDPHPIPPLLPCMISNPAFYHRALMFRAREARQDRPRKIRKGQ